MYRNGGGTVGAVDAVQRMRVALMALGWSAHSGTPRIGPKAAVARWGLEGGEPPEAERWALELAELRLERVGFEPRASGGAGSETVAGS